MPTKASKKNPTQKTRVAENTPPRTKRKPKWALWAIISCLVVLAVAVYLISTGGLMDDKARMAAYLEDKYGKEFVVENYHIGGSGIGIEGDPRADAHPKDDPALKFDIWDRGNFQAGEHAYSDGYLTHLWSKQAKKEIESLIQADFSEAEGFLVNVGPIDTVNFEFSHGRTPNLKEALESSGNQMFYSVSVKAVVPYAATEPSGDRLEDAMRLVEYVKSQPVKRPEVHYLYRYPDFSARDQLGKQRYQFSIEIEGQMLQGIRDILDIKEHYRKLR